MGLLYFIYNRAGVYALFVGVNDSHMFSMIFHLGICSVPSMVLMGRLRMKKFP